MMSQSPFAAAYRLPTRSRPDTEVVVRRPIFDPPRVFGRGLLTASGLVLPVESRTVASWLPASVRLGCQEVVPEGTHPVVILTGHQQGVHMNLLPRLRLSYREWVILVPYTRIGGDRSDYLGPFLCPVARHTDRLMPNLLGGLLLAAPKAAARFEGVADMTRVYGRGGRFLAELATHKARRDRDPVSITARRRLVDVLQQPNICGRQRHGYRVFGADWGIYDARLQALDANLTVAEGLVADSSWYIGDARVRGLSTPAWARLQREGGGVAFSLETRWLMGLPEKCSPALRRWRAGGTRVSGDM